MIDLKIIGNLTADPTTAETRNGKRVCNFTVAVNNRNDKEHPDFVRVSAWYHGEGGGLADVCARYLHKGSKVYCSGKPTADAYTAKDGQVRANLGMMLSDMEMLSSNQQNSAAPKQEQNAAANMTAVETDELPF